MQPQKLCLKWNNHTANLLSVLGGFQQRDILVDVTISCEGHNIKAHKLVLSACSPYFQNIFLENPCQHPVVIINGMKYEDITAILNFMYKGEVNVSQDGLTSFLQAAEALKVKGLAEVCGEKRSTNSSSQEVQQNEQQTRPQRTDTPPRKRHRNRKRSLSDSNRSDDEGSSRKQHREPSSPEVHELSGDESFTGDTNSNGPPFNTTPRVPQNVYSRSHQSSSNLGDDDDEFEVEPSKLLEQTLTTDNVNEQLRYLEELPEVPLLKIFSYLHLKDLCRIRGVCRRWYNLAGSSSLWRYIRESNTNPNEMEDVLPLIPESLTCLKLSRRKDERETLWLKSLMFLREKFCPKMNELVIENFEVLYDYRVPLFPIPAEDDFLTGESDAESRLDLMESLNLKILNLTACSVTASTFKQFCHRTTYELEELYLQSSLFSYEPIFTSIDSTLFDFLAFHFSLKVLDLENVFFAIEFMFEKYNKMEISFLNLEELYISNTIISDAELKYILGEDTLFPQLKMLCIKNTRVTKPCVEKHLKASTRNVRVIFYEAPKKVQQMNCSQYLAWLKKKDLKPCNHHKMNRKPYVRECQIEFV